MSVCCRSRATNSLARATMASFFLSWAMRAMRMVGKGVFGSGTPRNRLCRASGVAPGRGGGGGGGGGGGCVVEAGGGGAGAARGGGGPPGGGGGENPGGGFPFVSPS